MRFVPKCGWAWTAIVLAGCIEAGVGRVIDSETKLPIAGAEVRFECQASANIESWRTLRLVVPVTDDKGFYRFSRWDLLGCEAGYLSARKKGYVSLSGSEIIWHTVNGYVFQMAPEADAKLRILKLMHGATVRTERNARSTAFSSTRAEYHSIYFSFINSRNISVTPREKAFVIENYCARLTGLYERLSPQDRVEIAREKEMVTTQMPMGWATIDHEAQVVAYCKAR